jgi:hypothetical protein
MSNLDDKLRDILFTASGGITDMANAEIEAIKQTFKDAGYRQSQELLDMHTQLAHELTRLQMQSTPQPVKVTADFSGGKLSKLMTGQEWYELLSKKFDEYAWTADEKDSILQAAFEVSHDN